jgi:hypothetical protein
LSPGFSSSSADASGFSWTDSIILPNSNWLVKCNKWLKRIFTIHAQ